MPQNRKLMPNLDKKSTKLLNLTVLQRIDPFVEEILITAAHVTFYELNVDNRQWSRKDVEGSFFVVKRNTQPRFQFIVMNRRNTDNLVENLLGDFEYEVQIPYLLYRNSSQEVNGIWFYNAHECEEVADLFSRILNAYAKVPTKSKPSPTKSEFEELEAIPTLTVMDGPLEPSASNASNAADVPDDRSLMNFFSNSMNIGNSHNVAISGQPYHSASVVSAYPQNVTLPILPSPLTQKPTTLSNSTHIMSVSQNSESVLKRLTDLVKPSSFFGTLPSSYSSLVMRPPVTPSVPTAPLNTPRSQQRPYGTPLLQPFPPPTPPLPLTPTSVGTPNYGPVISREKVGEALQMLVQDNQFIDIVYQAILNAHES